jgi:hypothetical protein
MSVAQKVAPIQENPRMQVIAMNEILNFNNLSIEAQWGKAMLLLSAPLSVFALAVMIFLLREIPYLVQHTEIFIMAETIAVIATLDGYPVRMYAAMKTGEGDYRTAGTYALIAALLPSFDVVALAAGVLCHISPEAKAGRSVEISSGGRLAEPAADGYGGERNTTLREIYIYARDAVNFFQRFFGEYMTFFPVKSIC